MENTGFNQVGYTSFTPKVTSEHNSKVIGMILVSAIAITAGVLIYTIVRKNVLDKNRKISE